MLLGIAGSLVASVLYAVFAILITEHVRKNRAKPFTGSYGMFGPSGLQPTGGIVRIERKNWRENLFSPAPVLEVFAEHGSGRAPGTEDWSGNVEVLGFSKIATGYYWYPNRAGGALRFKLSDDADQMTEYGTPFNAQSSPFMLVLKRKSKG
jgi:hypothetical protein